MAGPLAHLTVLDLTDLRGALAGRLFADLGADVIKIEPPGGDPGGCSRRSPATSPRPIARCRFSTATPTSAARVIDLHDRDGAARFAALVRARRRAAGELRAESPPGARPRAGGVRERYPQLVHVIIADFGLSGPRAHWRAEPLVAFAASGALFASGFPIARRAGCPASPRTTARRRSRSSARWPRCSTGPAHGAGQTVEVSVQEAAISGFNPWQIPLADYHRLYPMLPDRAAAQRRRQLPGAADRRRARAHPARGADATGAASSTCSAAPRRSPHPSGTSRSIVW